MADLTKLESKLGEVAGLAMASVRSAKLNYGSSPQSICFAAPRVDRQST